jgi:hypothetical protein
MADLMRGECYTLAKALVEQEAANDPNDQITAAESSERRRAAKSARASTLLSGFKISPETEALTQKYINGEIEFEEIIKIVLASVL